MTPEEVHKMLCKMSDEDKMRFSLACQMNGTSPKNCERILANVFTGIEKSLKLTVEYYKYLEGK